MKPTLQTATDTRKTRRFHTCVRLQISASSGSAGHAGPGRNVNQPDAARSVPDTANTQALCNVKVTRKGRPLDNAATAAPNPNVTNAIGNAQQMSVPKEASRASNVRPFSRVAVFMPHTLRPGADSMSSGFSRVAQAAISGTSSIASVGSAPSCHHNGIPCHAPDILSLA
jgi:hypothetical protein